MPHTLLEGQLFPRWAGLHLSLRSPSGLYIALLLPSVGFITWKRGEVQKGKASSSLACLSLILSQSLSFIVLDPCAPTAFLSLFLLVLFLLFLWQM